MVRSLLSIFIASLILAGAAIFEGFYVSNQFEEFGQELNALYLKVDEESANIEDAKSVQAAWDHKKDRLHIWIPHNDITRIDDYLSETVRLISEKQFSLALSKLQVLVHLSECLPGTYSPAIENVF